MSFWTAAVIIAGMWMLVQIYTRHRDHQLGVTRDEDGNPVFPPRAEGRTAIELEQARRELNDLRERVKVLERIATDANTGDAREQARIAAEIEALRGLPAARTEGTDQ